MIVQIHLKKKTTGESERQKYIAIVILSDGKEYNQWHNYFRVHEIDPDPICFRRATIAEIADMEKASYPLSYPYKEWLILLTDELQETQSESWIQDIIRNAGLPYTLTDIEKKEKSIKDKNKQYSMGALFD